MAGIPAGSSAPSEEGRTEARAAVPALSAERKQAVQDPRVSVGSRAVPGLRARFGRVIEASNSKRGIRIEGPDRPRKFKAKRNRPREYNTLADQGIDLFRSRDRDAESKPG